MSVLWIRIGFNADLAQAFMASMRIRIRIPGTQPMRIHADPDPGQRLCHPKKLNICMKNIFYVSKRL
jgi:hypothetical protein